MVARAIIHNSDYPTVEDYKRPLLVTSWNATSIFVSSRAGRGQENLGPGTHSRRVQPVQQLQRPTVVGPTSIVYKRLETVVEGCWLDQVVLYCDTTVTL
jgi:hypothetical protein